MNNKANKANAPVKVLQFGEGNFLRAFVDHMLDIAIEKGLFSGSVQIVKPIRLGSLDSFREQGCVYTVLLRDKNALENRVITCIAGVCDSYDDYGEFMSFANSPDLRFVVSNTTEAGIVYDHNDRFEFTPPSSFPGKLTKLLFERFEAFGGDKQKGLIILPVELIENNGKKLKECCLKLCRLWGLPREFDDWLVESNIFCNTLVDRIVTGYPKHESEEIAKSLGYDDPLLVCGEPFGLWVIESDSPIVAQELPLDKAGLPIIFTDNLQPYRERKVRILNGGHTASVAAAYLSGLNTVDEIMSDPTLRSYLEKVIYSELAPMVPLPQNEVYAFADQVMERFENPYIKHQLLSITLNSVSKFRVRVLPTIVETAEKTGKLPSLLCFSLAALMQFYSANERSGQTYEIHDAPRVLEFFAENSGAKSEEITKEFLSRVDFWGRDLNELPSMSSCVAQALESTRVSGMRGAVEMVIK